MAADDAAVVVTLRANLKDYEAALKSAVRSTETAARAAEKAVSGIGKGGGASKVIEGNFKKSSQAIANDAKILQFQLNDIFSGLASGQGIRAVQMQLGQIAQQMTGASLAGGARLLGSALLGMVNPLNLAIVAFGVLAGVAASYFTSSTEQAKAATDALKKQADELDNLAKKYGKLFPEIQRAADRQHELLDAAEKAIAVQTALTAAYEDTGKTLDTLGDQLLEIQSLLDFGDAPEVLSAITKSFNDLKEAVKNHNASSKDAQEILKTLNGIIASTEGRTKELATTMRDDLVKSFQELDRAAKSAGETIQNSLNFSFPGAGGPLDLSPLTGQNRAKLLDKALEGAADAIDGFTERVIAAEGPHGGPNAAGASSAFGPGQFIDSTWLEVFKRNFAAEAAGMSDAAILALRSDLETNRRMIRAYATENARALKDAGQEVTEATLQLAHFLGSAGAIKVLSAAPGTKISNIPGMGAAIAANPTILGGGATREDVLAYAKRRQATAALTKENKELNTETEKRIELEKQLVDTGSLLSEADKQRAADVAQLQQQMQSIVSGALSSFTHDLINGADAGEAFNNMLKNVASQIADLAVQMLIIKPLMNSLFGSAGSSLTGAGLFEAGGTVGLSGRHDGRKFSPAMWAGAPRFAAGGMVGLRPGEMPIIAHRGEIIIPNARRMAGAGAAGGGGRHTVDVRVSAAPSPLLDLSIKTSAKAAEERAVSRGPAVARDNNRRYATP